MDAGTSFDDDLEVRVQAVLARERAGEGLYDEQTRARIGRLWWAMAKTGLGGRRYGELAGDLIALYPNQDVAVDSAGTFYRKAYCAEPPSLWKRVRVGLAGGASCAALAGAVVYVASQGTALNPEAMIGAGTAWLMTLGAGAVGMAAFFFRCRSHEFAQYQAVAADAVPNGAVELAHDYLVKDLAYYQSRIETAQRVRRFDERTFTAALQAADSEARGRATEVAEEERRARTEATDLERAQSRLALARARAYRSDPAK
jgi:hypothetical protein